MIGKLPRTLNIDGKEYKIRTDYRAALLIIKILNDVELSNKQKIYLIMETMFFNWDDINIEKAIEKLWQFLDGGKKYESNNKLKIMDWEQDEQIIFSAINKVAHKEVREIEYMHWWTFLGLFSEIEEGFFSTVINIRQKKSKGKKLEKHEQEFYNNNKELINLKKKYTAEEQKEIDRLNKLLQ